MICPNCRERVLAKERTGQVCSKCGQTFAFDPKLARLHDLQFRKLAERHTDGGRYLCTIGQLRYALDARTPRRPRGRRSALPAVIGLAFVGAGGGLMALAWLWSASSAPALLLRCLLGFVGVPLTWGAVSALWEWYRGPDLPARVEPRWSVAAFRWSVVERWKKVYRSLPTGVVEELEVQEYRTEEPLAAVLLCPDFAAADCLRANGFPMRHRTHVITELDELPDEDVPVVVLHDASAEGLLLVEAVRTAVPGRLVVDGGLTPAFPDLLLAGTRVGKFVQLRRKQRLRRGDRERLGRVPGLSAEDFDWVAGGWWSPLAAVPPKYLLTAAARAVDSLGAVDAAGVGFLSWPAAPIGKGRG